MENNTDKIAKKYTPAERRLTSNHEFYRDAELMWEMKETFMQMAMRKNQRGDGNKGRRLKLYNVVFEYVKEFSTALKKKTWGEFKKLADEKPKEIGEYWVREEQGKAVKMFWKRERFYLQDFEDLAINASVNFENLEWSIIYK